MINISGPYIYRSEETDDNYDDHCPKCDGIEFSWIDYDADTKEGRANREKYCEPTKAEFIAMLDNALTEIAEESGIEFDNGDEDDKTGTTIALNGSWPF